MVSNFILVFVFYRKQLKLSQKPQRKIKLEIMRKRYVFMSMEWNTFCMR